MPVRWRHGATCAPCQTPPTRQYPISSSTPGEEQAGRIQWSLVLCVWWFCSDSLGTIVYTKAPSSTAAPAQVLTTLSWMHELARKCFCVSYWLSAAPPRHCPVCRNTLLEALNTFYTVAEAPPAPLPPTSASPGKYISAAVTTHLWYMSTWLKTTQSLDAFDLIHRYFPVMTDNCL